jgi:AcrR family transcriptional regulator
MSTPEPKPLREACVDEAFAIVGEKGVAGLSIREVARRLGVSHQAPYKHFPSSGHLLAEIVRRTYVMFTEYLNRRPRSGNPPEDMYTLGQAYLEFARKHPIHYRLMFDTPMPNADLHPAMKQAGHDAFAVLLGALAGNQVHGRLDALFVWAAVHGLATIQQTGALKDLGFTAAERKQAADHLLQRIGAALAIPDGCPPEK